MRSVMVALLGLTVAASGGGAAEKPTANQPGAKAAPACAALVFRPLPGGGTDGEQTAGRAEKRRKGARPGVVQIRGRTTKAGARVAEWLNGVQPILELRKQP